jgi:hypothetical protein
MGVIFNLVYSWARIVRQYKRQNCEPFDEKCKINCINS